MNSNFLTKTRFFSKCHHHQYKFNTSVLLQRSASSLTILQQQQQQQKYKIHTTNSTVAPANNNIFNKKQFIHTITQTQTKMSGSTGPVADVAKFLACDRPAEAKEFVMQQTMFRVKDINVSLDFCKF